MEEIVKTEGIPYKKIRKFNNINLFPALIIYDQVPRNELSKLRNFLSNKRVLLTVNPTKHLTDFLGLDRIDPPVKNGYLEIGDEASKIIQYNGLLQIFGESSSFNNGKPIVDLIPSKKPGILEINRFGGKVIIICFDLYSTFLTMQQSNSECGKAVDVSRIEKGYENIPQLDLLRRLITNLILSRISIPIPRKWYYPNASRSLLVVGGDQDGSGFERLQVVKKITEDLGIPYTLFLMPTYQPIKTKEFQYLRSNGFEFALHPDFFKYTGDGETAGRPFTQRELRRQHGMAKRQSKNKMLGNRTHAVHWKSVYEIPLWMEKLKLQYDSSLGLNLDSNEHQKMGYYMGSSLPYYFIHPKNRRRIDVLEQPFLGGDDVLFWPEIPDYEIRILPGHGRTYRIGMGLTEEEAYILAKKFMDESINWHHGVQCYVWHPVYLASKELGEEHHHSDIFFKKIIKYSQQKKVSILNHGQWNSFWRAREKTRFTKLIWDNEKKELEFILSDKVPNGLTILIPITSAYLQLFVNGKETEYSQSFLMEQKYAHVIADTVASYKVKYSTNHPTETTG